MNRQLNNKFGAHCMHSLKLNPEYHIGEVLSCLAMSFRDAGLDKEAAPYSQPHISVAWPPLAHTTMMNFWRSTSESMEERRGNGWEIIEPVQLNPVLWCVQPSSTYKRSVKVWDCETWSRRIDETNTCKQAYEKYQSQFKGTFGVQGHQKQEHVINWPPTLYARPNKILVLYLQVETRFSVVAHSDRGHCFDWDRTQPRD